MAMTAEDLPHVNITCDGLKIKYCEPWHYDHHDSIYDLSKSLGRDSIKHNTFGAVWSTLKFQQLPLSWRVSQNGGDATARAFHVKESF